MPIRTTFAIIIAMLPHGHELDLTGDANPLWGGEKAYYLGGGWWRFKYHTNRGKSVVNTTIESLTRAGKTLKGLCWCSITVLPHHLVLVCYMLLI